jgi:hypothetical protein
VLHAVGSVSSKDPYSGSFFQVCNSDRTSLDSLSFCMAADVELRSAS